MASSAVMESFLNHKVAVLCFVLLIIWFFRDALILRPYKKYAAWIIHKVTKPTNEGLKKEKAKLFQVVQQYQKQLHREITVLEIGSGSVSNLTYLPQNTKLVCLDPNPYFNDYAKENIKKQSNVASPEIVKGYAEDMPFESGTFDVVVSTLVLCSVKDVKKSLAEIQRVLKPGGKFVFLEHVAYTEKFSWGYTSQVVMRPFFWIVFDGCTLTRDNGTCIKAAGFSEVNLENFLHKPLPIMLKPCISGTATK